jgi:hypothetical protein
VIGLDYGSLSCRGILADVRNGCILAESEASYLHGILTEHLPDGTALADSWCLQHPQDYLTVLDQILPQLLSKSMIDPDAIIGIGLDFTASTVIPLPYLIKLNGQLGDDWCVGDQVSVTYENGRYDTETNHFEGDLKTIEVSTFRPDPFVAYKPVIYLYPEAETEVSVKLRVDGGLTCTYPAYGDGWRVTAAPDGTLTDGKGQTYNYLYWEGQMNVDFDLSAGFCVRGTDTAAFLEDALQKLGLNRREANEFIVYWLPLMEGNPYNIISFQTDAYTDAAALDISPAPDTVIRVFMAWKRSENFVEMEPQNLTAPPRTGFTVIEWGGTQIPT